MTSNRPFYRRRKPRDSKEAALLRERGTPEYLIGPTRWNPSWFWFAIAFLAGNLVGQALLTIYVVWMLRNA